MKILFFAEAVTLAHIARPLTLIDIAATQGWECHFATADYFDALMPASPLYTRHALSSIARARFANALKNGTPIYDLPTLKRYVDDDLSVIETVKPDVIVGDFRVSLSVSARLTSLPYAAITNAYWSPYARREFPIPDLPLTRVLGVGLAQKAFNILRPLIFRQHAAPIEALRRTYGMPDFGGDLCRAYTDADLTLLADLPDLAPPLSDDTPAATAFLGPLQWSPRMPEPPWWQEIRNDSPLIYINLGSSGQASRIPGLLDAIGGLDATVVVGGVSESVDDAHQIPRLYAADYLPGDIIAARASVFVCNGGSPSTTQALTAGVPVLALPGNLDQFMNASVIAERGLGILLRGNASEGDIQSALRQLLYQSSYKINASRIAEQISSYNVEDSFLQHIARLINHK